MDLREFKENIKQNLNNGKIDLTIVSYSIDETTREIMNYLRNYGIQIKGLEFKYFESDEKEYFVTNWIGEEEVERIEKKKLTPAQRRNLDVFSEVLEDFKSRNPGVTYRKAGMDNWLSIPMGHSNVHLEWWVHRDSVEVGFHIESDDKEWNMKTMNFFKDRRDNLEKKIGKKLSFEPYGKKWARVYVLGKRNDLGEKVRNWMKETMNAFYGAFKPLVGEYFGK